MHRATRSRIAGGWLLAPQTIVPGGKGRKKFVLNLAHTHTHAQTDEGKKQLKIVKKQKCNGNCCFRFFQFLIFFPPPLVNEWLIISQLLREQTVYIRVLYSTYYVAAVVSLLDFQHLTRKSIFSFLKRWDAQSQ